MDVDTALKQRISIRAFKPDPVPEALVREILDVARWAPSGGNVQPWNVIAVAGAERQAAIDLMAKVTASNPLGEPTDRPIYPADLWEPHASYRFKVGEDMYGLLGIPRDDKAGRLRQFAYNREFFGAPVALFIVLDERMGHGQWAHTGMFMQSLALAAEARGLGTCMQEFWGIIRPSLKAHFGLAPTEMVYCAIALGWPDRSQKINTLRTSRAEVDQFSKFKGF